MFGHVLHLLIVAKVCVFLVLHIFWQLLMHVSEQKNETEHFKFAQEYALKSMGREKGGGYFELYHVFFKTFKLINCDPKVKENTDGRELCTLKM